MFLKFLGIVSLLALQSRASVIVVDDEKYFDQILTKAVASIEEIGFRDDTFALEDFPMDLNFTAGNGWKVQGNVRFYEGFVSHLKEIAYGKAKTPTYRFEQDSITIGFTFIFVDVHMFYDVELSIDNQKDIRSIEMLFKELEFESWMMQDFKTGAVNTTTKMSTITSSNLVGTRAYPYDHIMQATLKSLSRSNFEGTRESIRKWDLNDFFQKAAEEVDFPQICYNC